MDPLCLTPSALLPHLPRSKESRTCRLHVFRPSRSGIAILGFDEYVPCMSVRRSLREERTSGFHESGITGDDLADSVLLALSFGCHKGLLRFQHLEVLV